MCVQKKLVMPLVLLAVLADPTRGQDAETTAAAFVDAPPAAPDPGPTMEAEDRGE